MYENEAPTEYLDLKIKIRRHFLCYYITRERTRPSNFQISFFLIRKSPVIFSSRRPISSLKSSVVFLNPSKQMLESIHLWLYSPFVGSWPLFQFLEPIHSR
jgi:hypothetical protein